MPRRAADMRLCAFFVTLIAFQRDALAVDAVSFFFFCLPIAAIALPSLCHRCYDFSAALTFSRFAVMPCCRHAKMRRGVYIRYYADFCHCRPRSRVARAC